MHDGACEAAANRIEVCQKIKCARMCALFEQYLNRHVDSISGCTFLRHNLHVNDSFKG